MELQSDAGAERGPDYSRKKRNCLIFLLVWAIVSGFVYGIVDVDWEKPLLLLDMIVFAITIIRWTHHDAEQHEFTLWRYFIPLMVICPGPLFVMPVYFVRSRGWSAGLVAMCLAIGFVILQLALDSAATYLAFALYWGG